MKDDNELLIGYRPELQYEDEYVSDIDFNTINNQVNDSDNNDSNKEEIENLIQDMNDLSNLIDKLPNNIAGIIDEVYDQVVDFIEEELADKELLPVPDKEEWIYGDPNNKDDDPDNNDDYPDNNHNPDDNDPDNNDDPDDNDKDPDNEDKDPDDNDKDPDDKDNDPDNEGTIDDDKLWNDDDFFPIEKEKHSEEEIIEKEYIKNLVDLFKDYQTNLHTTITNFWMNFILASNDKTSNEIKMLLNNILLSSSDIKADAKHLLDSAVRQQLIKTMKFEYYNMMFNAEETIKQLKQFKAIYELRLRYAKIATLDGSTKTNQSNNNILIASKMIYDKKYDIAYENLYRYLSSSNKLLNDSLQAWIQEIKSKQILIERKGINK